MMMLRNDLMLATKMELEGEENEGMAKAERYGEAAKAERLELAQQALMAIGLSALVYCGAVFGFAHFALGII